MTKAQCSNVIVVYMVEHERWWLIIWWFSYHTKKNLFLRFLLGLFCLKSCSSALSLSRSPTHSLFVENFFVAPLHACTFWFFFLIFKITEKTAAKKCFSFIAFAISALFRLAASSDCKCSNLSLKFSEFWLFLGLACVPHIWEIKVWLEIAFYVRQLSRLIVVYQQTVCVSLFIMHDPRFVVKIPFEFQQNLKKWRGIFTHGQFLEELFFFSLFRTVKYANVAINMRRELLWMLWIRII